ncbi:RING-H2 finger protein ATL74 [Acorus calamus]|uniref:RING-H2 finger protein ATL74 n=1 Tax=Acorus calamus TaxID=4465 RepID=A0AAV9EGT5_ACOCL|nr:RING-H2 finger protein ATL74 [Acorus calamus]
MRLAKTTNLWAPPTMKNLLHRRFLLDPLTDLPPAASHDNGTGRRPSSGADSNLATNMVIIIAGILLAVACVLVRCALEGGGRTGLKKRALRKIPVAVYGAAGLMTGTECPICLGEFHEGERLRVLPECNHGFHVECIDEWLAGRSSCPMCRHSVLEVKGAPSPKMAGTSRGGEGEVVVGVDRVS